MNDHVPVFKDEDNQRPIPSAWRETFFEIVEALKEGDFGLVRGVSGVRPVSSKDASLIADTVQDYGAHLISLPEETWQTSACQWMQGYWDALIDLFTAEEGASDLVLSVRIYEIGDSYSFDIQSVYVP